jgi:hypothetical protein
VQAVRIHAACAEYCIPDIRPKSYNQMSCRSFRNHNHFVKTPTQAESPATCACEIVEHAIQKHFRAMSDELETRARKTKTESSDDH